MLLDLERFERELKERFSFEIEFKHSKELQSCIDYHHFTLSELCKITKGQIITAGPVTGLMTNSSAYYGNVLTFGSSFEHTKKIRFIFCEDTRNDPSITWVFGFPLHFEAQFMILLKRIANLKAFL